MTTTETDDSSPVAATQRPANLAEAIGLLSTERRYSYAPSSMLLMFVIDLIERSPELVMEKVLSRRAEAIGAALRDYRGEV